MHPVAMLAGNNEVGNFNNVVDITSTCLCCVKKIKFFFPQAMNENEDPQNEG